MRRESLTLLFQNGIRVRPRQYFGRRNVSMFQGVAETFVTMHETCGLPWFVLIPVTTIALRTVVTLPLSIWQRKRIVKQQELRKLVEAIPPITKLRLAAASTAKPGSDSITSAGSTTNEITTPAATRKQGNLTADQITLLAAKETRNRQKKLFAKYNVQMWKNAILPLVQVPLWVTISMGIRTLTESRLLESNHYYWLSDVIPSSLDLSLPLDSLPMLIPMVLGTLSLVNVEYNGNMLTRTTASEAGIKTASNENSRMSRSMNSVLNISRLSCVFMMGISSQAPLLLALYWISSQLFSLVQNTILNWLWPYKR